jgi:hypothetical protein
MKIARAFGLVGGLVLAACGGDESLSTNTGIGKDGPVVGGPCKTTRDCADGSKCTSGTQFPDGMCTVDCLTDLDCPEGSYCIGESGGVCHSECAVAGDCRNGYSCYTRFGSSTGTTSSTSAGSTSATGSTSSGATSTASGATEDVQFCGK